MIRQVLSLSVVALFALSAISARGQETAPKAPERPAVPATVGSAGRMPSSAGAVASNPETDLAKRVAALEKEVAELKQYKKAQVDINANNSEMLHQIATFHPTPEGGQRLVPNVQAIRDDHDARHALVDTVVQDMTRKTGELRIRNEMNTGQSLVVNGVDTIYVPAHSDRIVTVPSGTATTELAGEGTKSWMIGVPNYSQEIIIAPAVRSTVVNPWQYDAVTGVWWRNLN